MLCLTIHIEITLKAHSHTLSQYNQPYTKQIIGLYRLYSYLLPMTSSLLSQALLSLGVDSFDCYCTRYIVEEINHYYCNNTYLIRFILLQYLTVTSVILLVSVVFRNPENFLLTLHIPICNFQLQVSAAISGILIVPQSHAWLRPHIALFTFKILSQYDACRLRRSRTFFIFKINDIY